MRSLFVICVLFLLVSLPFTPAHTQWSSLGPVGPVSTLAANGSTLFAGSITGGGVAVSTDGGSTWRAASAGLPATAITALAATPSKVFAAVSGEGIWASTDAGATWTQASNGLISNSVNVISSVGTSLFTGPSTFGAFRSTDGGDMWLPSGHGFATGMAVAFIGVGTRIFGASASAGVYVSTDGGDNWSLAVNGLTSTAVTALASIGTTVFAATSNKGLFLTTDNGANWSNASIGIPNSLVVGLAGVTPAGGTPCLVAATGTGVFGITKNAGASWDTVDPGLTHRSINALLTVGTTIFAATGDGILRSTDGGYHWSASGAGLATAQVTGLTAANGAVMAGTKSDGIWSSSNGGATWTAVNGGLGSKEVTGLTRGNGTSYAATMDGIYALTNGGVTWTKNTKIAGAMNTVRYLNGVVYVGPGALGIYRSADNGASWQFGSGSTWDLAGTIVQSFGPGLSSVMAGTNGRGILGSANSGSFWSQLNTGLTNLDIRGFIGYNGHIFAATGDGPFMAADGAESWAPAMNGFGGYSATAIALFQDKLIAGSKNGGVFVSTDQGGSWKQANTGLAVPTVSTVEIDSPYVYIGTDGGGVYRRQLSELFRSLAVDPPSVLPDRFALGQSYPNPFNPSTVIPFELGASATGASHVTIRVFDMLGREVAMVLDEPLAAGHHEVRFDGTGLASGVYIYRMEVRQGTSTGTGFRESRTMVLVR